MTKTKTKVDSPTHIVSSKERRLTRLKMDGADKTESTDSGQQSMPEQRHSSEQRPTPQQPIDTSERKKKINRATSPARLKEGPGWSLTKIRGGIGTPALSVKPGAIHLGSRVSRRSPGGGNDSKPAQINLSGKSPFSVTSAQKGISKSLKSVRRKMSDASICSDDASKDSGFAPGKLSPTDSSSEISDCVSEENRLSTEATNHTESTRGLDGEKSSTGCCFRQSDSVSRPTKTSEGKDRFSLGLETSEGSLSPGDERSVTSFVSRVPASTSLAFSDLTEEFVDSLQEEFVREIEELRSENDYLKDEIEELRSEMLEMRDMYLEEDVYQLQEIRQQLEQANKACRILQYRLRKTERRSLHVAQTGQVDGELVRTLEQDIKVAKDVSIRLHSELDIVEKKIGRLEQENKELRLRTQDLEVAKQVLQQELEKNFQKKRGARPSNKSDKKLFPQEDSSDLKCQLHFAKEEAALMCKKLTKLVKDSETMKEDLAKYRSLYGDVDASLTVEEVADSPHTREAEVKVHLKLVEEEANLLSRRIVELEVENRGLRAEMDYMKGQDQSGGSCGIGAVLGLGMGGALALGGASSENVMELQRHLQFVEEEAELLRRSLIEMEEHNKLLMNEMNRYKSELPPSPITSNSLLFVDGMLNDSLSVSIQEGAVLISTDHSPSEEELRAARLQIGELSGKVKSLQYENRVLLSHLQRCDLASYQNNSSSSASSSSLRPFLEMDAEAGDSAECPIPGPTYCEGSIGNENDRLEVRERKRKFEETIASLPAYLGMKDHDALLAMRDQACLVTTSIQLLTSPEFNCLFSPSPIFPSIYHKDQATEGCDVEKPQPLVSSLADLVGALTSKLHTLQTELQAFVEQVDSLENCPETVRYHRIEQASPLPLQSDSRGLALAGSSVSALCAGDNQLHNEEQIHEQRKIQEEHHKALVLQDLQFQSSGSQSFLHEKSWGQEHALLVQESQHLKQTLLLLSLKLRCFLKHWRLGRKMEVEGKDVLEVNNLKDLYLLLEEDSLTSSAHQNNNMAAAEELTLSPNIKSSDVSTTLADLKVALQDLSSELRQERQGSHELTQQFAKAKASWEVERTELKSFITQLECKTGKETALACKDMEVALKREREEHHHLLADSYAAVMDLTKQLQIGERNWSREKLELLERFSHERGQWEQGMREVTKAKIDHSEGDMSQDTVTNGALSRTKSTASDSELADVRGALPVHQGQKVSGTANEELKGLFTHRPDPLVRSDLDDLTRKNWTYLTNVMQELGDSSKTWDGHSGHSQSPRMELGLESIKRSYTAPDRTSIRIYYSPPAVRRIESCRRHGAMETPQALHGHPSLMLTESGSVLGRGMQNSSSICPSSSSSYEQWLSSLSTQHQELLENRGSARSISSGNGVIVASSAFHGLEISANLSDDMKEMTNCVRQAIRSSSVERNVNASSKESTGSVMAPGMANHSTQTVTEYVSIGLQTDTPSRGSGLQSKAWLPRPSSTSTSSLASARSRQISSSLDKVHSRIDRPCCSPKYGSPKLQRRVSSVSTSRLEGSSRERSLWSLQSRGGGGSAWARSTTTRDSPVLSGLNDGLSSLFSVVENSGSVESLWRGYGAIPSQGASPARQPPAAGKPSGASTGTEFQDFLRNEYGGHAQGGSVLPGERLQREGLGLSELEVDEPKPDYVSGVVGLAGIGVNDRVHRIVHKRFMRHPAREESAVIGGKEYSNPRELPMSSIIEDASCDCGSQSLTSSLSRPSRSTTSPPLGHFTHRTQESPGMTDERADPCIE